MKIIFLLLLLIACGGESSPPTFFILNMNELSFEEQSQINNAVSLINDAAGRRIFSSSGSPVSIKRGNLADRNLAPENMEINPCTIIIDPNSDVVRSDIRLVQYVFAHQMGRCRRFPPSFNINDVMFPTFNGIYSRDLELRIREFARKLANF